MERYRKPVYCDWEFLASLLSKHDESSCLDNSFIIDREFATDIQNLLLCSDVKLYLNISSDFFYNFLRDVEKKRKNALKKGKEPLLTALEKLAIDIDLLQQNNVLHLHFNSSKIQFNDSILETNQLNALFFSSESKEVCANAMKEYGIIVLCAENIHSFKYLTFDQGVALQKTELSNWNQCLSGFEMVPCNSLILIDNYILNDGKSIEENLRHIFNALIPKTLNKMLSFQLTIFTTLCNDRGIPYNSASRLEQIQKILNELRPNINFNISIIKCSKDKFHDRTIITNNLFIGSGGGFDLFKNGKAQKTTTVCVFHPFLNNHTKWSRKAYSNVLNDASKVFSDTTEFDSSKMSDSFPCFSIGDKRNRLLISNNIKKDCIDGYLGKTETSA